MRTKSRWVCAEKSETEKGRRIKCRRREGEEKDVRERREEEECWRGWCYPLIACQTATASFIPSPLLFLSFSSSFSSRSFVPLHLWRQYLRATHPPRPRHASPETWHKKRYCATPQSFLVYEAVLLLLFSTSRFHFGRPSTDDMHPEEASDRGYYTPSL